MLGYLQWLLVLLAIAASSVHFCYVLRGLQVPQDEHQLEIHTVTIDSDAVSDELHVRDAPGPML